MEKAIIIGAGISGLALGQMIKKDYNVSILEKAPRAGGLIKCERVNGNLYHTTGGHVFNTKRDDVFKWFWSFFNKENEFTMAKRNAAIAMANNQFIPYPIENNLHQLDKTTLNNVIHELLAISRSESFESENFKEFLLSHFGKTLYDIYFKPYNEKIWQCSLSNIPLTWLQGKLPMPSIEEILFNNIKKVEESSLFTVLFIIL